MPMNPNHRKITVEVEFDTHMLFRDGMHHGMHTEVLRKFVHAINQIKATPDGMAKIYSWIANNEPLTLPVVEGK